MEQMPKKGRRAYLDDFRPGANGDYVYCGKQLTFCGDAAARRRFRLRFGCCFGLLLCFEIAAGCLNVGSLDNTMLVLIPYILQILFAAAFLWSAGRLLLAGDPLRAYVYRQTVRRLPALGLLLACFAAATGICAAICLILQKAATAAEIVYTGLFLAISGIALCGAALIRKADWKECE